MKWLCPIRARLGRFISTNARAIGAIRKMIAPSVQAIEELFLADQATGAGDSHFGSHQVSRDPSNAGEFVKNLVNPSRQFATSTNRRFQFQKRSQLFIRAHNETAFRRRDVRLQSRSFARWNQSLRHSPTPTRFAEIVGDDFPVPLHAR